MRSRKRGCQNREKLRFLIWKERKVPAFALMIINKFREQMLFLALRELFTFKFCLKVKKKKRPLHKTEGVTGKRQLSNTKIKKRIIRRKHNKCKSNHKLKMLNSHISYRIFKIG